MYLTILVPCHDGSGLEPLGRGTARERSESGGYERLARALPAADYTGKWLDKGRNIDFEFCM